MEIWYIAIRCKARWRTIMAKIIVGRLPQATTEYERSQFDTLIRELEQIVTQLNFSYEQQTKDETLARSWYIG